jgi:hypothetical protein
MGLRAAFGNSGGQKLHKSLICLKSVVQDFGVLGLFTKKAEPQDWASYGSLNRIWAVLGCVVVVDGIAQGTGRSQSKCLTA